MSPATIEALRVAYAAWAVLTAAIESDCSDIERLELAGSYVHVSSAAIALALTEAGAISGAPMSEIQRFVAEAIESALAISERIEASHAARQGVPQ